ncbi:E3 ubiquitin-protein ligase MARCHF5 [Halotydeus destructor]|nr:E3 ubiquitin-protein ligase MARCHF5 [Halotydeus destructor]
MSVEPMEEAQLQVDESPDKKHCWVCFLTEDEDVTAIAGDANQVELSVNEEVLDWVKPCKCKGSAKWVHQLCLQRWIDEKQRANGSAKVSCAQCKTEYVLMFPQSGAFVYVLEIYDKLLYAVSPFAAATFLFGSVYCSACVYGAVTILQVLGQDDGKMFIEATDPFMLVIGLPSIPLMLILGKLVKWEDSILRFWRRHYNRIPLLGHMIGKPPDSPRESADKILLGRDTFSDPLAATRMFCGALVLPTASLLIGKYFFSNIASNFQRTIIGGLTFIAVKGFMRIYLRQQQYVRHTRRTVCDYDECAIDDVNDRHSLLDALDANVLADVEENLDIHEMQDEAQ